MKKLSLLLIALASMLAVNAVPTLDLQSGSLTGYPNGNGGYANNENNNGALWEQLKTDFRGISRLDKDHTYGNMYLDCGQGHAVAYFLSAANIHNTWPITKLLEDGSEYNGRSWVWLGDYIKTCCPELDGGSRDEEVHWRHEVNGFFMQTYGAGTCGYRAGYTLHDWSTEGDPNTWRLAYALSHNLKPTRSNYNFVGWFDNAAGTGTKITTWAQAKDKATIYAVWRAKGEVVWHDMGANVPTPELKAGKEMDDLFVLFKQGYKEVCGKDFTWTMEGMTGASQGADVSIEKMITTHTNWQWLEDYIIDVARDQNLWENNAAGNDEVGMERKWRFAVWAFFNQTQYTGWPKSADFSTAGKPANWINLYQLGYLPVKYGYAFKGWYSAESGGIKITTSNINNYADAYGQWTKGGEAEALIFSTYERIMPLERDPNAEDPNAEDYYTFVVSPTPYTANIDNISWSSTGGITVTPGDISKNENPYMAKVKPTAVGPATITMTKGSKSITYDVWVAGVDAGAENAQIGVYAFNLDLKYHSDDRTYDFIFSTNAGLGSSSSSSSSSSSRILVALQSEVDAAGSWKNLASAATKKYYELPIDKGAITKKGTYKFQISELDLQKFFGSGVITDDNFQPTQTITWAVELVANDVEHFAVFRRGTLSDATAGVLASNDDPETVNFGRLYGYFKGGNRQGAYTFDPVNMEAQAINAIHEGGNWDFENIGRIAIDNAGVLYITEKGNNHPGIYVGITDEHDLQKMTVWPFFPKNLITVDISDKNGSDIYPIIKDNKTGNEIGSAFLAVDTYVKTVNGATHAVLFAYAKGHQEGVDWDVNDNGTWELGDKIPYHCIVEYDLGPVDNLDRDYTDLPKILSVIPFENGNHHAAHTANIIATNKGMWICHDREMNSNTNYATSLQFYGANGCTYTSATNINDYPAQSEVNQFINGSKGAAIAVNKDNNVLIMGDAKQNLLVFTIVWGGTNNAVPTLTLRDIYHHNLGTINQMEFDFAGNLLAAGENGMMILTIPHVFPENKQLTPANDRYILSRMHQYDCVFTGEANDGGTWGNQANWMYGFMPDATSDALIRGDITVDVADAKAHCVYMNKDATTNPYKKLTVAEGKSLTVADKILWVAGSDPVKAEEAITSDDALITVKPNASLTYTKLKGAPLADVSVNGTAVRGGSPQWQQTAMPFSHTEAAEDFYGAYLYAWDEANSGWTSLGGWGNALERFKGYMMTQKAVKEYVMTDKLEATHTPQSITLSNTGGTLGSHDVKGYNLIGNSWVSPIQIKDLAFTNAEASVYIYQGSANNIGQYAAWPTKQSNPEFETIAPLQAFFVKATGTGASVTLNYHNPLASTVAKHGAPRRAAEMEMPNIRMKIDVAGEKAGEGDVLYIFESAMYSYDFDNGYESTKMEGDAGTPYLAATTAMGELAVLATPTFEGTMLNFRQGTSQMYTFTFTYDDEDVYYLEDKFTGILTEIRTGNSYFFTVTDDDSGRFYIVRKADQGEVVTSLTNVWAADNKLFLENPLGEEVEVRVFSADGKMVQATTTTDRTLQLHVPIAGVYTVQLRTNDTVQTIKCIM